MSDGLSLAKPRHCSILAIGWSFKTFPMFNEEALEATIFRELADPSPLLANFVSKTRRCGKVCPMVRRRWFPVVPVFIADDDRFAFHFYDNGPAGLVCVQAGCHSAVTGLNRRCHIETTE